MSKTKKPKPLSAKLIYWWHPTLNGDLIPEDFNRWSKQVIWFLHYDRKWKQWHAWDSMLSSISRKENCPICTGHRLVVGINDLATRNPTVAAMWHPTLNGDLTPQMFTEHAKAKVWWRHKDKETGIWHEWPMPISKLTSKEQQSCSICSGQRIQVGANDLATTHPDLASEWHSTLNGALTPQMVSKGIEIEVWWQKDCFNNGIYHIWHAMPNSRTGKNPKGCAICYGKQIQIGVNDLASQYPTLALEWDEIKNKKLTPQMVTKGYTLRVFWKHKDTDGSIHGWPASPNSRTGKNPSGCPECVKYAFDPALPAHLYVLFATIKETQVI